MNTLHLSMVEIENRIMGDNSSFYCVPSLGSLGLGHCLIFTKKKYLNLAQIDNDELCEFEKIFDDTLGILTQFFNNILVFEQGSDNVNCNIGCGIDIAHLHLIPTYKRKDIILDVANNYEQLFTYTSFKDFIRAKKSFDFPYIAIGTNESEYSIYSYGERKESQAVRKIIAKHHNHQHWDWKLDYNIPTMLKTYELLNSHFQKLCRQ